MDDEDGPDDSDITPAEVVADIVGRIPGRCIVRHANGDGLSSVADTEALHVARAPEVQAAGSVESVEEKGRGSARKKIICCMLDGGGTRQEMGGTCLASLAWISVVEENRHVQRKFTHLRT